MTSIELEFDFGQGGSAGSPEDGGDGSAFRAFDPFLAPITPGLSLVEASAGTGKTFNITMTVLRLLLAEHDDGTPVVGGIGNILVVTFTKAATNELVTRIRAMLGLALQVFSGASPEQTAHPDVARSIATLRTHYGMRGLGRVRQALSSIDTLSVFTIHGFCQRVLEQFALESGTPFGASLVDDERELVQQAMHDWWRRTFYEDARLASVAVAMDWQPEVFLADYWNWSRFPDTAIDPAVPMEDAFDAVDRALAALREVWNPSTVARELDALGWLKGAALGNAQQRAHAVERGSAAAAGDLGAAVEFSTLVSTAAFEKCVRKTPRPAYAHILAQPFVHAADAVCAAIGLLVQAMRVACLHAVQRNVERAKTDRNVFSFDDLLVRLRDALRREGADGLLAQSIRRNFQAALIDEFQDTDPAQFPIFETAFRGRPLYLIGDPKQAIYGFRGADVHAYIDAAARADRRYTLEHNWRSTPEMVKAVNVLFARREHAFMHDAIRYHPASAAKPVPRGEHGEQVRLALRRDDKRSLHWMYLPPDATDRGDRPVSRWPAFEQIADATVHEIVRLVGDGGMPCGAIAILVRTSYEGVSLERLLRRAGVPAVVAGLGSIVESAELADLEQLLHAIAMPGDSRLVRAALCTTLWGANSDDLLRMSSTEGEAEWDALRLGLEELREVWSRRGFMPMMQRFIGEHDVHARWLALTDGDRRLTNLRHAVELVHEAANADHLTIDGVLHWIAATRAERDRDDEIRTLRLERDADAVRIVTMHSSKGLEYDVVFCTSLWNVFSDPESKPVVVHESGSRVFDHGSPSRAARGRLLRAEQLSEDLRLAYVALTRARYRTYVAWGPIRNKDGSGSWQSSLGYLLADAPARHAETLDTAMHAERIAETLKGDVGAWQRTLERFVADHAGVMSMETVSGTGAGRLARADVADGAVLQARAERPAARQYESWSIASYSGLVAGGHAAVIDAARDVDVPLRPARSTSVPADRGDIAAFPAGAGPGVLLHDLFEHARFDASLAELRALAETALLAEGVASSPDDARIDAVAGMMQTVLRSPIGSLGLSLDRVPHARTMREWEFLLPLGETGRDDFAERFATLGGNVGRRYAPYLHTLNMRRVHGFLTGFVDLVFEHDGRWYVVDWKSNLLGTSVADYSLPRITEAMDESHYTLQYHLYVVALHRFLRLRVPGYSYATHMGGAAYAFLRGVDASGNGWYVDLPDEALVESLSALMDAGSDAMEGAA